MSCRLPLRDAFCGRRFYDKAHKLDVLDFFKAQAVHPDAVPDAVFRCIGRTVWADIGEALMIPTSGNVLLNSNLRIYSTVPKDLIETIWTVHHNGNYEISSRHYCSEASGLGTNKCCQHTSTQAAVHVHILRCILTVFLSLASWELYIQCSQPYLSRGAAQLNPYPLGACSSQILCISHCPSSIDLSSPAELCLRSSLNCVQDQLLCASAWQ